MIRLRTLGACAIEVDGTAIGPEAERVFAALVYLVTERGRAVPRRAMQELLWPDADDAHGRHNLRQVLYKLRQAGVAVASASGSVTLPPEQVASDPLLALDAEPTAAGDALLGGIGGEYLPGYAPTFSRRFADWVEGQRAYVHAQVARAAVAALLERRARGRWGEVETLAQLCLRYDPLNEEATLALAEAAALTGSKTRAIAILDEYIAELGGGTAIQLPAALLRRRIAERLPEPTYTVPSEASFVGRDASLRHLHELFTAARAGRGRVCLVHGEAGVGKTRLAAEFARVASLQGAQVQRLVCRPRDATRPLGVFADGVTGLLRLPGAIGCSPRSMQYLRRLTEHDPDAELSADSRDAAALYANVRRSILDLLGAVADERTLLLVVEDVHWADASSLEVLADVVAWCETQKVLVLLTSREARPPGALTTVAALLDRHALGTLPDAEAAKLVGALLEERQRRADREVRERLVRAAGGNALFLRELTIRWLETAVMEGVPASLEGLLRDRLDRLTPTALGLFQSCALMGDTASFERLEAVLDLRQIELLEALGELGLSGLLRSVPGGVRHRHELLADVALTALTDSAREYLHRRIALAFESDVRMRPGDASAAWECAEHWRRSGTPSRSLEIIFSSGRYLLELGVPLEAIRLYEQASQYISTTADRGTYQLRLAQAYAHAGRWLAVRELLREDAEHPIGPNHAGSAQLLLIEADLQAGVDPQHLLVKSSDLARNRKHARSDRLQFALASMRLADFVCAPAEIATMYELVSNELAGAEGDSIPSTTSDMIFHAVLGDLELAQSAGNDLVRRARVRGDQSALSQSLRSSALVAKRLGLVGESRRLLLESAHVAEASELITHAVRSYGTLTELLIDQREYSAADEAYQHLSAWLGKADIPALRLHAMATGARLRLVARQIEDASLMLAPYRDRLQVELHGPGRLDIAAVLIETSLANAEPIAESISDRYMQRFSKIQSMGEQDYAALVGHRLLVRHDQAVAAAWMQSYIRVRRERGLLPPILAWELETVEQSRQ